jgi:antitoxin (DNA-binding transcriptional repressor) of toxin-antitoxin stability system
MQIVDVEEASTDLPRLIERARAGEEIVIALDGSPAVRLVPVHATAPRRRRGSLEGEVVVPASFFDPLPPGELDAWSQ